MTHPLGRFRSSAPGGRRFMTALRARTIGVLGTALIGAVIPAEVGGQARGAWAAGDRILISDFSTIVGLAGDRWRIYAATANGLLTWDPARNAWGSPLTFEDGYPVTEGPSALAWSDAEQALVLGTRAGRLWRLDPAFGQTELLAAVSGPVDQLLGTSSGDVYVHAPAGWLELAAGSMVPRPVGGPPAAAIPQLDDALQSLRGTLAVDQRLRRWPVTALVPGTRPGDYYAGTAGGGLLRVDARTLETVPMPYGGTGRVVTALALVAGTLWFAGGPPARGRASVFSADTSLQHWNWPDQLAGAPAIDVGAMIGVGGTLWVGGADGLYRLRPNGEWDRFDTRDRLPGGEVTALAAADSSLWVGTRRGACLWQGDACGPTLLAGEQVTALSYCGRALWIGTDRGLWQATGSAMTSAEPPGFSGRVQALACLQGALYAAEPRRLAVYSQGGWAPPIPVGGSGTVRALRASAGAVWVAGDAGAARWDPAARAWSTYLVPNDVPVGPVLDVLPDGDRVWLATPAGALRLELHGP